MSHKLHKFWLKVTAVVVGSFDTRFLSALTGGFLLGWGYDLVSLDMGL
jgi:hypothetical protein